MISIKSNSYAANEAKVWAVNATMIRCLTGNASFRIEGFWKGEKRLDFDGFQAGLSIDKIASEESGNINVAGTVAHEQVQIDQLIVTNGSTAQTIALIVGDGDVSDNRLVGTVAITGGLNTTALSGTVVTQGFATSISTVGSTMTAATTNGIGVLFQNIGTTAIELFLAGTTPGTGVILEPVPAGGNVGGTASLSAGVQWNARQFTQAAATGILSWTIEVK